MLKDFTAASRAWFTDAFSAPTPVQEAGWQAIAAGQHALLLAPTGSGKTLAAFFWAIDRLLREPVDATEGVRVLYISPLKALVYDIERNLRAPLVGTLRAAERLGQTCRAVSVDMRTGDTPAADRRRQLKHPGDILVTTPESLYLLLGSQAANTLRTVHTIIIDEVHALAPTKRGAHLALSLERLSMLAPDAQRIGLSATVRPHDEAAKFLGGDRPVQVVDRAAPANIDLKIVVPVPDMEQPPPAAETAERGGSILGEIMRKDDKASRRKAGRDSTGMWAAIYPTVLERVRAQRSTIVFVNSRSLCERLAQRLNELAEEKLVRAHHGSLALRKRMEIEEALKAGTLRGIIATSSLELGIDMGSVDMVILVESPGSVARGLQRVGRAGHQVGEKSRGLMLPKFRGDLLECAVVAERMRAGQLEPIVVPQNALDVLAQQVVAMCVAGPQTVADLHKVICRSYPYHRLSREALVTVLEMLSGTYPSDEFADLRPHLSWDRTQDIVSPRRGARLAAVLNAGTIPDRGMFGVYLVGDGPRVGELDEEMVHESRKGDTFMLGATTWRVEDITRDRVIVSPAPGEPGRMPFWRGDGPGRPIELGQAMGAFVRFVGEMAPAQARRHLMQKVQLDAFAADNLVAYLQAQREQTGTLPTDRNITVERFRDEIGDWRVCILTPFGSRVHAPWALALERSLSDKTGLPVQTMYSDDGIVLRFAESDEPPGNLEDLLPDTAVIEDLVVQQLSNSALFASHFRENAGRALLLPRRRAEARTPLWQQRLKSKMLLAAAQRYPSFPIVLETYRQCLRDIFDLPALKDLLGRIRQREVTIDWVETRMASPFARSLAFAYVSAYLYEQDSPMAERKAQLLTLDRDLLRELLGQAELRELLDVAVLDEVESELQCLSPERQARDADEVHDMLRRLGDLTAEEIAARCCEPPEAWLAQLVQQRRALQVRLAQTVRFIAAEDAGRYRDALGVMIPGGLPERFLSGVPLDEAFVGIVRRYARHHGPFVSRALASRYHMLPAQVEPILAQLERDGGLVHGELRPHGNEREWCDADVLRKLKRRTLAKLRQEVAAVESQALARFMVRWHKLDEPRRGPAALEDVLAQLEGQPLSWAALCDTILPARLADFHPDMLDMLCATGAIVWVGCGPLGQGDGRVKLLRRLQAPLLLDAPPAYAAPSQVHSAILEHLARRGACFSVELQGVAQAADLRELEAVLWDLVWAGQITNDTVQPLRGLGSRKKPSRRRGGPVFGGRWYRVVDLLAVPVTATECAHARATMLLGRYGVVCREAAATEDMPGGFSAVYGVLKAMEEAGKVRRGYFVEGLSGLQFAYAGAVERLRVNRSGDDSLDTVQIIAAIDPANPYGALLPWPQRANPDDAGKPRRVAGASVILQNGAPLMYVDPKARGLFTFAALWAREDALAAALRGLATLARTRRGQALHINSIDGVSAHLYPFAQRLQKAGLTHTFDGFLLQGPVHA